MLNIKEHHLLDIDKLFYSASYIQTGSRFKIDQVIAVLDHETSVECAFQARKRASNHPAIFAFHGTGSDCIYSLQRNSLRNLSNSQMMTVGAVHGAGIYISN